MSASKTTRILTVGVRLEHHVVLARQRARQIAAELGFDRQDQTRVATAVSEIARNALVYAGGGCVEFGASEGPPPMLVIAVTDQGPGIANLETVLRGDYVSRTGMGAGLIGSRRLMDRFEVNTAPGKTTVTLGKQLPVGEGGLKGRDLARVADQLTRCVPENPLHEVQQQNQEMLRTLEELRARQAEVEQLNVTLEAANRELAETNRGMVALYKELDDRAEELRRASELKSRFLSYISHEFRTPLGSVLRLSQLLLDRMDGDLTAEQEKQVLLIRKASEGLTELVNDLLDLGKIEAGKASLNPNAFQVEELLGTLRGLFRPLIVPGTVELMVEEASDIPELYGDEGKLSQILRNFISNAVKFTPSGEIRVRVVTAPDDHVEFSVADSGIGIPPELHEHIFEEFTQVDSPVQRRLRGTGLGLPLSRRLAELMGGRVWLESCPGEGSTFYLSIPRRGAGAPPEGLSAPEQAPEAAGEEHILIVDDDDTSRYVLRRLLAEVPYAIREAAGGEQGLEMAREPGVRAVLLDLVMPGMMGMEVLERLKSDPATRDIPVVVVTSLPLDESLRARLGDKPAALLSKLAGRDLAAMTREALCAAGVLTGSWKGASGG